MTINTSPSIIPHSLLYVVCPSLPKTIQDSSSTTMYALPPCSLLVQPLPLFRIDSGRVKGGISAAGVGVGGGGGSGSGNKGIGSITARFSWFSNLLLVNLSIYMNTFNS